MKKKYLVKVSVATILVATSTAALATLWQTMDAESASISGNTLSDNGWSFPLQYESNGAKPALSTTRAYAGSTSLYVRVAADTDSAKERSEIQVTTGTPFNQERWMAFAVYIPSNFQAHPVDRWLIVSQVWQSAPASPPIALEFKPNTSDKLQLLVRNDDTGTSAPNIVKNDIAVNKGAWNIIKIGFRLSTATTGFVKLYVNGVNVHNYNGKVGYTGSQGNVTPKIGLYGSNSTAMHELWFDNLRYASTQAEANP